MKKLFSFGYSSSGNNYIEYTDIHGYTGSAENGDSASSFLSKTPFDTVVTNKTLSSMFSGSTTNLVFSIIGNSITDEEDYALGSMITDNLLFSTAHEKTSGIFNTVIVNTGTTAITYDEIALLFHNCYSNSWHNPIDPTNNNASLLLIKEKLDTPRTLAAGESVTISFSLFGDVITNN